MRLAIAIAFVAACGGNNHPPADRPPPDSPSVTLTQQAYVKASNPGGDAFFGTSIAFSTDGSTMAIGASEESSNATGVDGNQADSSLPGAGAVYVFARTGTTWAQQAYIKAGVASVGGFGTAIALSSDGSTLLVSAPNEAPPGGQGAAYVYVRAGTTWALQTRLASPTPTNGDLFGQSVALSADGNTAAIGAYGESSYAGGVHLFTRSGTTWTHEAAIDSTTLQTATPVANDNFGWSVALSSDGAHLAVGAIGRGGSGAVYLFTNGTVDGMPLANANGFTGDNFGWQVALSGDGTVVAVGSPMESDDVQAHASGTVHVFRNGSEDRVHNSDAKAGDNFGTSVSLSMDGATLLVGAPSQATGAGAGYLFSHGSSWAQTALLKASNPEADDNAGTSVAVAGDAMTMTIGAPGESSASSGVNGDENNDADGSSGASYVFVVQ